MKKRIFLFRCVQYLSSLFKSLLQPKSPRLFEITIISHLGQKEEKRKEAEKDFSEEAKFMTFYMQIIHFPLCARVRGIREKETPCEWRVVSPNP